MFYYLNCWIIQLIVAIINKLTCRLIIWYDAHCLKFRIISMFALVDLGTDLYNFIISYLFIICRRWDLLICCCSAWDLDFVFCCCYSQLLMSSLGFEQQKNYSACSNIKSWTPVPEPSEQNRCGSLHPVWRRSRDQNPAWPAFFSYCFHIYLHYIT